VVLKMLESTLGTWGIYWELIGNLLITKWEQNKSNTPPLLPPLPKKEIMGPLGACYLTSLVVNK
jgi:hypothetical protein